MSLFSPEITYSYRCFPCKRNWWQTYKGFWQVANMPDKPQAQCPDCHKWYRPKTVTMDGETNPVPQ